LDLASAEELSLREEVSPTMFDLRLEGCEPRPLCDLVAARTITIPFTANLTNIALANDDVAFAALHDDGTGQVGFMRFDRRTRSAVRIDDPERAGDTSDVTSDRKGTTYAASADGTESRTRSAAPWTSRPTRWPRSSP
jgi:hypothetical protein